MIPKNYVLTDEGNISNYLGVNIKKNSYGAFELLQSYLVEKIINHVRLTLYESLKSIEKPAGKLPLHKDEYIIRSKFICNYRRVVGMLNIYSGINMTRNSNGHTPVCTFFNNPHLVHKRAVRYIAKYLVSMSTYVDLPDGNQRLSTCRIFYSPNKEKCI